MRFEIEPQVSIFWTTSQRSGEETAPQQVQSEMSNQWMLAWGGIAYCNHAYYNHRSYVNRDYLLWLFIISMQCDSLPAENDSLRPVWLL